MKSKRLIQNDRGEFLVIPSIIPDETGDLVWHISARVIRVVIPQWLVADWLEKKHRHEAVLALTGTELHPQLVGIINLVQSISNEYIVYDNGNLYIYLEELYSDHKLILQQNGVTIETKS